MFDALKSIFSFGPTPARQALDAVTASRAALSVSESMAEYDAYRKDVEDFARISVSPNAGRQNQKAEWPVNRNLQVKQYKGSVYIAISVTAKRFAMSTMTIQRKLADGTLEDAPHNDPLVELFEKVNQFDTRFDLWYQTIGWRLLTGDSYWWKCRNGLGGVAEIWPIPSQWTWAVPHPEKFIAGYKVEGVFGRRPEFIEASEIVHIREPSMDWSGNRRFYGFSPSEAAQSQITAETEMWNRVNYKFANFSAPGMIFEPTNPNITPAQVELAMHDIIAQHSLACQYGRPMLSPKNYKLASDAREIREISYQQSLDLTMDWTLASFGVPKVVLGLVADSNRANSVAAMITFNDNVITPLQTQIGEHLTQDLARPDFGEEYIIGFKKPSVEDADALRKDVQVCVNANAVTGDECREILLEREPLDYGGAQVRTKAGQPIMAGNGEPPPEPDPIELDQESAATVAAKRIADTETTDEKIERMVDDRFADILKAAVDGITETLTNEVDLETIAEPHQRAPRGVDVVDAAQEAGTVDGGGVDVGLAAAASGVHAPSSNGRDVD